MLHHLNNKEWLSFIVPLAQESMKQWSCPGVYIPQSPTERSASGLPSLKQVRQAESKKPQDTENSQVGPGMKAN